VPIQVGGGIRDLGHIESYLDAGVTYIVIGTAAVKESGFSLRCLLRRSRGTSSRLDAKDQGGGRRLVQAHGHDVVDLAKKYEEYGIEALVYTDIGRDGMMSASISKPRCASRSRPRRRSSLPAV